MQRGMFTLSMACMPRTAPMSHAAWDVTQRLHALIHRIRIKGPTLEAQCGPWHLPAIAYASFLSP